MKRFLIPLVVFVVLVVPRRRLTLNPRDVPRR